MSQYYYLVATLPTLSSDSDQFMSPQSFLKLCQEWVSRHDLALIKSTILFPEVAKTERGKDPANSIIRGWQQFELKLRNELVRQRALQLKREPSPYLRKNAQGEELQGEERLTQSVRATVLEAHPLVAEQMLNNIRWRFLNELERDQFFSVEFLQVYYLKLQLLERAAQFAKEQGEARFQHAYVAAAKQLDDVAAIQI